LWQNPRAMRAAAFQFDVRRGDVAANLAAVERGLASASERGIELVVLPEMWPTSFVADGDPLAWQRDTDAALARVQDLSRALGLVVAGSAFGAASDPAAPRNRLTVFERGERVLVYDKLHLFSPTAEAESFSAGAALSPTVATLTFAGDSLVADGTVLAEGRGTDGLVAAELDLAALRALRRAVPVRRDKRRDLVAPG
jgi:predicted amidohydrolase